MSAFQFYGPHHPPAVYPNMEGEVLFDNVETNIAHVGKVSVQPPPNKRARKAPTLNAEAWIPYKARVLQLHVEEGRSLKEVAQMMEEESGFIATERQYRIRISQWNKDKNIKPAEMQAIVRKRQYRKLMEKDKMPQRFEVRDRVVTGEQIDRWMKRNNACDAELYEPDIETTTPSAVMTRTISNRSSYTLSPRLATPLRSLSAEALLDRSFPNHPSPGPWSLSRIIGSPLSSFAGHSPAMMSVESPEPIMMTSTPITFQEQPETLVQDFNESVWQSLLSQDHFPDVDPRPSSQNPIDYVVSTYSINRFEAAKELQLLRQIKRYEGEGLQFSEECLMEIVALADILRFQARCNTATAILKNVIALSQRNSTLGISFLRQSLNALGLIFLVEHRLERAELAFRKSLSLDTVPVTKDDLEDRVAAMSSIGKVLYLMHRFEEAESISLQALQECTQLNIHDCQSRASKTAVWTLLNLYVDSKRFAHAEELLKPVLAILKNLSEDFREDMFHIVSAIARMYEGQSRQVELLELEEVMVAGLRSTFGESHRYTVMGMWALAYAHLGIENLSQATIILRSVVHDLQSIFGDQHPGHSLAMTELSLILGIQQQWEEANKLGEKAVYDTNKVLGSQNCMTLEAMANLGYIYQKQQRSQEACPRLQQAIEGFERGVWHSTQCKDRTINSLVEIYTEQGKWDDIEKLQKTKGVPWAHSSTEPHLS